MQQANQSTFNEPLSAAPGYQALKRRRKQLFDAPSNHIDGASNEDAVMQSHPAGFLPAQPPPAASAVPATAATAASSSAVHPLTSSPFINIDHQSIINESNDKNRVASLYSRLNNAMRSRLFRSAMETWLASLAAASPSSSSPPQPQSPPPTSSATPPPPPPPPPRAAAAPPSPPSSSNTELDNLITAHYNIIHGAATVATVAQWHALRARVRVRRFSPAFVAAERQKLADYRRIVSHVRSIGVIDREAVDVLESVGMHVVPAALRLRQRVVAAVDTELLTGCILAHTSDHFSYVVRFDDKSIEDMLLDETKLMPYELPSDLREQVEAAAAAATAATAAAATKTTTSSDHMGQGHTPNNLIAIDSLHTPSPDHSAAAAASSSSAPPPPPTFLPSLLFLLRKKELLITELRYMHDKLTTPPMIAVDSAHLQTDYAWVLSQLHACNGELETALANVGDYGDATSVSGVSSLATSSSSTSTSSIAADDWCSRIARLCQTNAAEIVRVAAVDAAAASSSIARLVESSVSLLLHLAICSDRTLTPAESTLSLYVANTLVRRNAPHLVNDARAHALFDAIETLSLKIQKSIK